MIPLCKYWLATVGLGAFAASMALGCSSSSSPSSDEAPDAAASDSSPSGEASLAATFILEFGTTHLEVDPSRGARVTALRAGGTELLLGREVSVFNSGSTFWPSPQSGWSAARWPPPASIDNGPYTGASSDGVITLTSEIDPGTHLSVTKKFTANLAQETVDIDYTMVNQGAVPASWAPWETTRMAGKGITFWPTGGAPFKGTDALPAWHEVAGHTWVDSAEQPVVAAKLYADGAGGWLAHVSGDVLLIKQFADQPASSAAPGEAEIEVYLDATGRYVEVEPQGAYAAIAPESTVTWKMKWYARKLPAGLIPSVGSAELIAFVMQTLK